MRLGAAARQAARRCSPRRPRRDLDHLDDEGFTEYGISAEHVTALRGRVNGWRTRLAQG
jgi:hypothetical protein